MLTGFSPCTFSPATLVISFFREDDARGAIFLGLSWGILDGRYLIRDPHPDEPFRQSWRPSDEPLAV